MTFVFDGTFEGLLTAIFDAYEVKAARVHIDSVHYYQPGLLDDAHHVIGDEAKASRVWAGLKKKLPKGWPNRIYTAFLSEQPETFQHIFDFAKYIFDSPKGAESNFGHPSVIALTKIDKSVNRERHRMKAFIRFQETSDGIFYAPIEPDFNVLALIAGFFKGRYADQKWIIYDVRRNYGLYYNLEDVEEIRFEHQPQLKQSSTFLTEDSLSGRESLYGLLWNDYFKSTNIPARKNMKLHLQHVPKRYWKYLTEKQDP